METQTAEIQIKDETNDMIDTPQVSKRPRRACRDREYNLRDSSLINRIETERRRNTPKQPKPKAKPPPLSKYRRRTANARERGRMKEINDAFDDLRLVIPRSPEMALVAEMLECESESSDLKLTKITTLRLAMNYIYSLRDMLGYDNTMLAKSSSLCTSITASPTSSNSSLSFPESAPRHLSRSSSCSSPSGSIASSSSSLSFPESTSGRLCSSSSDSGSEELALNLNGCDLGSDGTGSPVNLYADPSLCNDHLISLADSSVLLQELDIAPLPHPGS